MIKVVVLTLSVYNTATGTLLLEENGRHFEYSPFLHNNPVAECREAGVARAQELTKQYKPVYPWASTNVDCEWRMIPWAPA